MTKDEVFALAKQAAFHTPVQEAELIRFANLIHEHLTWSDIHTCHPGCTKPPCVAMREAVLAEREECAKVVDAERERVLGKQEGESWEPVNINIRMAAVLLPDIAAAIRSRT